MASEFSAGHVSQNQAIQVELYLQAWLPDVNTYPTIEKKLANPTHLGTIDFSENNSK